MDLANLQKDSDSSELLVLQDLERFTQAGVRLKRAKLELHKAEIAFAAASDAYAENCLEFCEVRRVFLLARGQAETK